MTVSEIAETLRRRIIADLHLGRLKPGSRLPSLRMVARELGVSIRAAARAYGVLQREGLVAVRGRSGIYLVVPGPGAAELAPPFDWLAEVIRQAWQRRVSLVELHGMLQDLLASPMTVACVESTEDHMIAFCSELQDDFGLESVSVKLTREGVAVGDRNMTLHEALAAVDFVVTTAFHATQVQAAADALGKPLVILSVSDTLVAAVNDQLARGPVTIVGDDVHFVERLRAHIVDRFRDRGELRVLTMDELLADRAAAAGSTVLYTRAARRRLNEEEFHLLPPPIPFLSAHAVHEIVQSMLSAQRVRRQQAA